MKRKYPNYRKTIFKKRKGSTNKDRADPKYVTWRRSVFIRDNFQCQKCFKIKCYLQAHHIRPWAMFPADRYDIDNGVTLCDKCHRRVHRSKRSKFLDLGYGRGKAISDKFRSIQHNSSR